MNVNQHRTQQQCEFNPNQASELLYPSASRGDHMDDEELQLKAEVRRHHHHHRLHSSPQASSSVSSHHSSPFGLIDGLIDGLNE